MKLHKIAFQPIAASEYHLNTFKHFPFHFEYFKCVLLHRTFKGEKLNYKVFAMEEFQTSYGFLNFIAYYF